MRTFEHDRRWQLTAGLILMVIGGLLLLDRLDVFSFHASARMFWPLILIWIGIARLMRRGNES